MVRKLITYFLLLLTVGLVGCSDVLDFQPGTVVASDGMVELTLSVPEMKRLTSRAVDPEFQVNDVTLLIYPAVDNTNDAYTQPVQTLTVYLDNSLNSGKNRLEQINDTQLRLSFQLDKNLRTGGFQIFFIANKAASISVDGLTVNDLKAVKTTDWGMHGNLLMFSYVTDADLARTDNVATLARVAAKVTVSDKLPSEQNVSYFPKELFGCADRAVVVAPAFSGDAFFCSAVAPASYPDDISDDAPVYFPQTQNKQDENAAGGNLFLITKASYNGSDYFYRLDFCRELKQDDGSVTYEYLDALCNHWYQFVVTEVTGPGYPSPAEAALHPANGIKYIIHDHSPVSYNMISDGVRELGVSHTFTYTGEPNADGEWSDSTLYLKFYSKYQSDLPASADEIKSLITIDDDSWLELSEPQKVTDADLIGVDPADDPNDAGVIYALKLRFKSTTQLGSLENNIHVEWMGLERDVPVLWERDFNGASLTSVSLTMSGSPIPGGVDVIDDYWAFLKSTDPYYEDGAVSGTDNLWGIQPVANNGKIRNRGFHFPVMYGSGNSYANYSYTLKFDKDARFDEANGAFSATVTTVGDAAVTNCSCEIKSKSPLTIEIKRPGRVGSNDYTYATGRMIVAVTFDGEDDPEIFTFELYHTGFFHKDSQEYRLDEQDSGNYYYYEVAPVQIEGKTRYILDRNLGAKSAQDCIIEGSNNLVTGSLNAQGGYYMIARQETLYTDPKMLPDVTPPGYRVPGKSEWDAIRQSSQFHTESDGRYFPAYYDTGNSKIGNVYFPKSMMWLNGGITGESRSGYYWTSTAATGAEKEEIGRWLNMLVLSGSSTSFSNGKVLVTSAAEAYGASVRCMNDVEEQAIVQRTNFNVSGATHVYLYTEDENQVRTATTTWPGHSIGNYATMTDGIWMGFSYSSSQFSPDQLHVIFNYVDEKGIIYSYSQKADGSTQCTTNLSPAECIGWKVQGDQSSAIVPPTSMITIDDIALQPASVSALGNWWLCENRTSGTPHVYDYKRGESPTCDYAFYWPSYLGNSPIITLDGEDIFVFDENANREIPGYYKFTFSSNRTSQNININIRSTDITVNAPISTIFGANPDAVNSAYLSYGKTFVYKSVPESVTKLNNELNPVPAGKKRIYMENTKDWPAVRIWYWRDSNGSEYNYGNNWGDGSSVPKMIAVAGYDNKIWYYDIPDDATHCLFVCVQAYDGTPAGQTANITLNNIPNYIYSNL